MRKEIFTIDHEVKLESGVILEKGDKIQILKEAGETEWICFIDEEEFDKPIDDTSGISYLMAYELETSVVPDENDNEAVSDLEDKINRDKIKLLKKKKIKVTFEDGEPSAREDITFLYPKF